MHGGLGEAGELGGGPGGRFWYTGASVFLSPCPSTCEPYHALGLVQGLIAAGKCWLNLPAITGPILQLTLLPTKFQGKGSCKVNWSPLPHLPTEISSFHKQGSDSVSLRSAPAPPPTGPMPQNCRNSERGSSQQIWPEVPCIATADCSECLPPRCGFLVAPKEPGSLAAISSGAPEMDSAISGLWTRGQEKKKKIHPLPWLWL